jgi:NADH-quinone oxidoreductase subunit J
VTGHDLVFALVGLVTAGAAVKTVTSTNLVHAALYLATTLAGIGGVFLVLHADFLALVQLVVYVGAITVLFLFGLMLTRAPIGREALDSQNRGLALGVSGTLFVVLTVLIVQAFGSVRVAEVTGVPIADIGMAIFSRWVLPFEVLSMLLLAALIGAIVLSRRETGESGVEAASTRIDLGDAPPAERDRRDGQDPVAALEYPELTTGSAPSAGRGGSAPSAGRGRDGR